MSVHRVAYILPYEGIGGVETAAASLPTGKHGDIELVKVFIVEDYAGPAPGSRFWSRPENNPLRLLSTAIHVARAAPDLVVGSLWRSYAVLLLVKLLRPWTRIVVFLHLPEDFHGLDRVLTRAAIRLAHEAWGDSATTLESRVPRDARLPRRPISFLVNRLSGPVDKMPKPDFIYWGRLHRGKNIGRALNLFAKIGLRLPGATYTLIGPDGGDYRHLAEQCERLGLTGCVHFLGPKTLDEICREAASASFYLQTSSAEGMALSIVEAMQLGLVPVVTSVGEVARYCRDGVNAILVGEDEETVVQRLCALLDSPSTYVEVSAGAAETWADAPLFSNSFLDACRSALASHRDDSRPM